MSDTRLGVFVGRTRVGTIRRPVDVNTTTFDFADSYLEMEQRPVLGQWFIDHLHEQVRTHQRLHAFFSNLLPEGRLRELVARHSGISSDDEVRLLIELGEDLPGAVRVVPESIGADLAEIQERPGEDSGDTPLKFSLAGVQLKFSVRWTAGKLTLPASGQGGNWLVKIPDPRWTDLPENEWSMLQWADAVGIEVPRAEIVKVADIERLPEEVVAQGSRALALERFDRRQDGTRIHYEDFAQVLGVYPSDQAKYKTTNYETLGKICLAVGGGDVFDEFVRRLVFAIAIGNGDAHIKNWALRYSDGLTADLTPAYDLVSTIQYIHDDQLGLNFGRSHAWERMSGDTFRRLAGKVDVDEQQAVTTAKDTAARIRSAWREHSRPWPLSAAFRSRIEQHWRAIPLMQE